MPSPPTASTSSPRPLSSSPQPQSPDLDSHFQGSPDSLRRPPAARLSSGTWNTARNAPGFVDSLTRATLPSASIEHATSYVEMYRGDGTAYSPPKPGSMEMKKQFSQGSGGSRASTRKDSTASIGSLKSLASRDGSGVSLDRTRSRDSGKGRESSDSDQNRLPPLPQEAEGGTPTRQRGASLSQLSWGTWWPFQVVEPENKVTPQTESRAPTPPSKDSHEDSRGFLSLFAGRQAVEDAQREQSAQSRRDQAEAELLETDLEDLRRLSLASTVSTGEGIPREADDSPFKLLSNDKSLPPTPTKDRDSPASSSFLPSIFSISSKPSSKSTERSSSPTRNGRKAPESTTSLLSSFTLANPFSSSSNSSTPSLLGPASPPLTPGGLPRPPHVARHYSTSRKQKDDEGPTAKKGEVEGMVDEGDRQAIEEEAEENAEMFSILKEKYKAPKLPLVFCHGLFGFDHLGPASIKPLQFSYWVGVAEALEAMGVEVLIGRVPTSASIEERAKVLCDMIGERFPGREVNLIGHSMGGLDGRFLISRLKPTNFKVRSLTTISTPHRGSSFADYLLEDIVGTSRVPALLSLMQTLGVPGGGKAFDDLTTTKMARFNEETPDDPSVRYFSYGAEFTPSWSNVFRVPWGVVYEREGTNDGLVSVDSSKWGEYQATLHNVNHLDLVGWVGKVRFGWAEWLGKPIKFKPISFFCAMAEMLAEEGY